jgi:hypothetical protein
MAMSNQSGQVLALVAAALAAGAAVAMVIEATPHGGRRGRSVEPEAETNPRKRSTVPNRADLIDALGLEPEGKSRGQKYAMTTKEYWHMVQHSDSRAAKSARRKLGIQ